MLLLVPSLCWFPFVTISLTAGAAVFFREDLAIQSESDNTSSSKRWDTGPNGTSRREHIRRGMRLLSEMGSRAGGAVCTLLVVRIY